MQDFIAKFKKISRILGWSVVAIFLLGYLTYLIRPQTFEALGIDIKALAKYTILFFVVKGTISTFLILYGIWTVRKKIQKKAD